MKDKYSNRHQHAHYSIKEEEHMQQEIEIDNRVLSIIRSQAEDHRSKMLGENEVGVFKEGYSKNNNQEKG